MEIMETLIDKDKDNYMCYNELKKLFESDETFRQNVIEGCLSEKISGYTEELWEKIRSQNIRGINNFEDVFRDGANIGYCTVASKQLSYSLDGCYICGGILRVLQGSKNSEDGSHTWIWKDHKIIDTTLMMIIDDKYAERLGYIEENRYDPNLDPIYMAAKDFTLDQNIGKRR